ncbi:MAG: hypothetical protein HC905_07730 [Bacteroidales bacterium]|nr:hypothetical protein [Bacteroidales bacterium]
MHIHLNDPQFKITELSRFQFKNNFTNLFINSFAETKKGELILGTTQGAAKYSPKQENIEVLEDTTNNNAFSKRITALVKNSNDEIFGGKSMHLARLNESTHRFEEYFKIPDSLNQYERDGYYDLLFDDNWLWMATENGLFKQNLIDKKVYAVIKNNQKYKGYNIYQIRSIDSDSDYVYAATLGGGLVVINKKPVI